MRRRLLLSAMAMVSAVFAMYGCSRDSTKSTIGAEPGDERNVTIIQGSQQADFGIFNADSYVTTLPNGILVVADTGWVKADTIIAGIRYQLPGSGNRHSYLKISATYLRVELCDSVQQPIFGFEFQLINDSTGKQLEWNRTDALEISTIKSGEAISKRIVLNGKMHQIDFVNQEQIGLAQEIYEDWHSGLPSLSFSEEERGLLERYLSMLDFMDANNIALKEDVEGEIASYLLIDEDFIEWLPYPQEIPVD